MVSTVSGAWCAMSKKNGYLSVCSPLKKNTDIEVREKAEKARNLDCWDGCGPVSPPPFPSCKNGPWLPVQTFFSSCGGSFPL